MARILFLLISIITLSVSGKPTRRGAFLLKAAREGNLQELKGHLDRGIGLELADRNLKRALILASIAGHLDVVKELLDRGANKDAQDIALHWAAVHNHVNVVKELLERGANTELQDQDGWTALHWAAQKNHLNVIKELLDSGANLDAQDNYGWTTLHWAARENHLDVVKELLDRRANVFTKDVDGRTALKLAGERGFTQIERVLKMAEDEQRENTKVFAYVNLVKIALDIANKFILF